jgi:hypothetical protein
MPETERGMDLDQDPRWRRLHDREWICPCCGLNHRGIFDLACARPEPWRRGEEPRPNSDLRTSANILTEDFCTLRGEHFFVRCVLRLPIAARPDRCFGFGVWATLSGPNFDLYLDTFDSGEQGDLGPWFGWFSNRLKGYPDTLNLKCQVRPQWGRQRPLVVLEPTLHPLALEQRTGITFDRLLEIYALNGHDLQTALTD